MQTAALLATALLFGGMCCMPSALRHFSSLPLPPPGGGPTIRRAFPHFYLFVIARFGCGRGAGDAG